MKITKKILIISITAIFVMNPYAAEARDCSKYPTLSHKWNMCKAGSDKYAGDGEEIASSKETSKKIDKKMGGFFQKIKNYGGKKIGEAD